MKIAHLSDPHLLNLDGVPLTTLFKGKRFTGLINTLLRHTRAHRSDIARHIAHHIRRCNVDHVIITGDLTNMALDSEARTVERWLRDDLGMDANSVSVVPGNHDRYTTDAVNNGCIDQILEPFARSDQPRPKGLYPSLRIRGPLALMGVDSALPQPPFVAAGQVGPLQREALREIFSSKVVQPCTPVVYLHHPPTWRRPWLREMWNGLRDAPSLQSILPHKPGLILHGHRHRTQAHWLQVGGVRWLVAGVSSASSSETSAERAAGYNIFEFDEDGALRGASSTTLNRDGSMNTRVLAPL